MFPPREGRATYRVEALVFRTSAEKVQALFFALPEYAKKQTVFQKVAIIVTLGQRNFIAIGIIQNKHGHT